MTRKHLSRGLVLLNLLLIGLFFYPQFEAGEPDVPEGLVFNITPRKLEILEAQPIVVDWELLNNGSTSLYVCQWPGPAFGGGWGNGDGKSKGFGPGYPHSRPLQRKFFIELKPGEALLGSSTVNLFGTEAGEVWLRGEYRSDQNGSQHGLNAWSGRLYSEKVHVSVPTLHTEKDE